MRMRFVACACLALLGCRLNLERRDNDEGDGGTNNVCKESTAAVCMEATTHSDFQWLETKVFVANCFGASCHTGPTASGKRDLSAGASYATLMGPAGAGGVKSNLDPTRDLVVPGNPAASYLFYIIRGIEPSEAQPPAGPPPEDVGYMPMSNALLCCQKIDAIERWILDGAQNN